ncbi:MAG: hypothetical protein ACYDBB_05405 [Armatimonadota bacterium]
MTLLHTVAALPQPRSLRHLGLDDYAWESKLHSILDHTAPAEWCPSGLQRSTYLDLMEVVVRQASPWQDERGAIIDPTTQTENGQTSPRFAAPGAILLAFGRVPDLQETVYRTMDWSCMRLATGQASSPDFWMRELAVAYLCLRDIANTEHLDRWRHDLGAVDPESTYQSVCREGVGVDSLHNWTVYSAAGEWIRQVAGLAPEGKAGIWGGDFFEKYMPAQLRHFTPEGMYRDPGDPITYDITTRLQLTAALAFGYDGPLRDDISELLRRGGLSLLLFASPEGYAPYGGRSSQLHFQEAIISALCEWEARRYKKSNPRLAGAFKRQAHLSTRAVSRWMEMHPFRHIKNGFPPGDRYGTDPYGHYAVYGLLAASFWGLAALFADDDIEEAPCPAEMGGYVFHLPDAFHKVFATCRGTHIAVDTRADFAYDATGLGRFHRAGVPLELGLGMPFTATPHYRIPDDQRPGTNGAISPEWFDGERWWCLADLNEGITSTIEIHRQSPEEVSLTLTYRHTASGVTVHEHYTLHEGELAIKLKVMRDTEPVDAVGFRVPLLVTDGDQHSVMHQQPGSVTVTYRGAYLRVMYRADLSAQLDNTVVGNRHGKYRNLVLRGEQGVMELRLALGTGANSTAAGCDALPSSR